MLNLPGFIFSSFRRLPGSYFWILQKWRRTSCCQRGIMTSRSTWVQPQAQWQAKEMYLRCFFFSHLHFIPLHLRPPLLNAPLFLSLLSLPFRKCILVCMYVCAHLAPTHVRAHSLIHPPQARFFQITFRWAHRQGVNYNKDTQSAISEAPQQALHWPETSFGWPSFHTSDLHRHSSWALVESSPSLCLREDPTGSIRYLG